MSMIWQTIPNNADVASAQAEASREARTVVVQQIAAEEMVAVAFVQCRLDAGSIILLPNKERSRYIGVGRGLTTKVNANVGTSADCRDYGDVLRKARVAQKAGAHTLMDLSTVGLNGDLDFSGG